MKARRYKWLIVLSLSFFAVSVNAFYSPIWFINDPVRDGNWWLKQAREAILQTERMFNYAKENAQNAFLSLQEQLAKESNRSISMQAKTTAISETKNRYADERYTLGDASALVCSAINKAKEQRVSSQCNTAFDRAKGVYSLINYSFGSDSTNTVNSNYMGKINSNSAQSSQPNADQRFVETLALQIKNTGDALGQYSLLTEDEYEKAMLSVDTIFGSHQSVPNAQQIMQYKLQNRGVQELEPLRRSLLYRAFVADNLNRRVMQGDLAKDGQFIDDGSFKAYEERSRQINEGVSSPMVVRVNAINTAKRLNAEMTQLKQSLQLQAINALKVKELRNGS